jgi:hypothetical protein
MDMDTWTHGHGCKTGCVHESDDLDLEMRLVTLSLQILNTTFRTVQQAGSHTVLYALD